MTLDIGDAIRSMVNDENRGVSPVIGVILMVAITVILAAVIATFVLGLGEQVSDTAPQASFTFNYEEVNTASDDDWYSETDGSTGDAVLTITHAGGASIKASQLFVAGSSLQDGQLAWSDTDSGVSDSSVETYGDDSKIQAGQSVEIAMNSDDTIQVVWKNPQGTKSATLREYTGPDA